MLESVSLIFRFFKICELDAPNVALSAKDSLAEGGAVVS